MTDPDTAAIVDALISTAQLPLTEAERTKLIADYPTLRAQADALYAFDSSLEPAVTFRPLDFFPPSS